MSISMLMETLESIELKYKMYINESKKNKEMDLYMKRGLNLKTLKKWKKYNNSLLIIWQ